MGRGVGSVRGGAGRCPAVFLPGPFRAVRGGDCPARARLLLSLSARTGRAAVSLKRCLSSRQKRIPEAGWGGSRPPRAATAVPVAQL